MKIYIYPDINFPVHDKTEKCKGLLPFSIKNLNKKYKIIDSPHDADLLYMGQFTCMGEPFKKQKFLYLDEYPKKHICDLEGDWVYNFAHEDILKNCLITTSGAKKEYQPYYDRIFIRPTFSELLLNIVKNYKKIPYKRAPNKKFAFKGFPDPHGVRIRIQKILDNSHIEHDIEFNNRWHGSTDSKEKIATDYMKKIYNNTFSLCPRGAGVDTVRFFESCYFGRIPIVVSNNLLFGEEEFKKSFFFKIDPLLKDEEICDKLNEIYSLDNDTIDEMSINCIDFFEKQVMSYFADPDEKLINWLKVKKYV